MASKSAEFVAHLRQTCPSATFGSAAQNVPPLAARSPPATTNTAPPNSSAAARPVGTVSDSRAKAFALYRANNACMAQIRQADQAGATDLQRMQLTQDCSARMGLVQSPIVAGLKTGIEYEHAGHYAEAAAAFQKTMNDEGAPNGDGLLAGEWLGYLYANGRPGVQKDVARARQLLGSTDSERYRYDIDLLDHNMLPTNPEGKTPALIAQLNAVVARENEKLAEQAAQWDRDHPHPVYRAAPQQEGGRCRETRSLTGGNSGLMGMDGCWPY